MKLLWLRLLRRLRGTRYVDVFDRMGESVFGGGNVISVRACRGVLRICVLPDPVNALYSVVLPGPTVYLFPLDAVGEVRIWDDDE